VLLGLVPGPVPAGEAAFAPVLPEGVGDVSTWEVVSGDFETAEVRGAYRLYVSPERQAIYQLMRYRVHLLAPRSDVERRREPGERVVFVRRPGSREPLRCWREASAGRWLEVGAGTAEYRFEMHTLIRVLAMHRATRAPAAPAAP